MEGSPPKFLKTVLPTERLYPSSWKDAAIRRIFDKQKGGVQCFLCGRWHKGAEELQELEGDHIVAVSEGGFTTWENLQLLCRRCNSSKGGRNRNST